jgi:ribosomal protein L15E
VSKVAKNGQPGKGRIGAVKGRTQFQAPNGNWVKRDTKTGRILDQKTSSGEKFKGVRTEN